MSKHMQGPLVTERWLQRQRSKQEVVKQLGRWMGACKPTVAEMLCSVLSASGNPVTQRPKHSVAPAVCCPSTIWISIAHPLQARVCSYTRMFNPTHMLVHLGVARACYASREAVWWAACLKQCHSPSSSSICSLPFKLILCLTSVRTRERVNWNCNHPPSVTSVCRNRPLSLLPRRILPSCCVCSVLCFNWQVLSGCSI